MGIERVAVCRRGALLEVPEFRTDHGGSAIGRVDVVPQAFVASDLRYRGDRIDRRSPRRSEDARDDEWRQPRVSIGSDRRSERLRVETQVLIDVDRPEVLDAGDAGPLLDGGMCLARGVGDERRPIGAPSQRTFAGDYMDQVSGVRSTRLEDPTARTGLVSPCRGEAEEIHQPVGHPILDLGRSRARRPEHPLHAEARADELAQDGRSRRGCGVVREPPR